MDIILNVTSMLVVTILTLSFFLTSKWEGSIFAPTENQNSFFASIQPLQAVFALLVTIFSLLDTLDSIAGAFTTNTTAVQPFTIFIIFYETLIYGYFTAMILTAFQPNLPLPLNALKIIFIVLQVVSACSVFTLFSGDPQGTLCYYAVGMASLVFLTIVTCFIMQSFLPRKNIVNGQFTMLTSTLVLLAANCARASANAVSESVFYVEAA